MSSSLCGVPSGFERSSTISAVGADRVPHQLGELADGQVFAAADVDERGSGFAEQLRAVPDSSSRWMQASAMSSP